MTTIEKLTYKERGKVFDEICKQQVENPANQFGSYINYLTTTIDWGVREYLKNNGIEEDDNLIDTITDEIKYNYF
tara:strand:+ start:152 stop:376 length:225 start_codon:yes stop_codon:yes gene_type:complete